MVCLHSFLKLVHPVHPQVFQELKDNISLGNLGQWDAACCRQVHEVRLHLVSNMNCNLPRALIDSYMACSAYLPDSVVQSDKMALPMLE